jgi:hypothetical protein
VYLNGDAIRIASPEYAGVIDADYLLDVDTGDYYDYTCENCGEGVNEHYAYWINDGDICLCEYCYDRHAFRCEHCGDAYWEDEKVTVNDEWWCEYCAREYALECAGCGDLWTDMQVETSDTCEYYCSEYCATRAGVYFDEDGQAWAEEPEGEDDDN